MKNKMKLVLKSLITVFALTGNVLALAQDTEVIYEKKKPERRVNTLISSENSFGGHFGFDIRGTEVVDESALLVGGHLVFNIDHAVNIGFAGYGMTSRLKHPTLQTLAGNQLYLDMGYGGFMIEPVFFDQSLVHFTVPVIIGAGWAGVSDHNWFGDDPWDESWPFVDESAFFVVEPGVNMELNLAKHVRFTLGASYRFVSGSDIVSLSDSDLSGMSIGAGIRVGWF